MSPLRRVDRDLRREGLRSFRLGLRLLEGDPLKAERLLRAALPNLVEAFLENRSGNADLFTLAHRIGLILVQTFKCPYEWRDDEKRWRQDCAILALHRRAAFSVALFWSRRCSVCAAPEFECDHVPGRTYNGVECFLERDRFIAIDHIAMVTQPDFVGTFMQSDDVSEAEIVEEFGCPLTAGEAVYCNHCRNCHGYFGPTDEDLDPSGWTALTDAAAAIHASRG